MNEARIDIMPYVAQAWRHRWYALNTAMVVCFFGWMAVAMMPDRYQASARIYVDTQSLLSPLMKGMAVDFDLDQQVQIMQRTLLSRPNLESVMRAADLDLNVDTPAERERMLSQLLGSTLVKAEGSNLFSVSYEHTDPLMAKRIVQSLLAIFVESNLGASRKDMQQAREFIDEQLSVYEGKLKTAEDRLAEFKQRYLEFLTSSGSYSSVIESARNELGGIRQRLADARTRQTSLQQQMKDVPEYLTTESAAGLARTVGPRTAVYEVDVHIAELQRQLAEMKLKFTDRHPDVVLTERRIESLRQQRAALPDPGGVGAPAGRVLNPLHEQLKLRLIEGQTEIDLLLRREKAQEEALARIEEKAKTAPEVEAAYKALNRDYDVIKGNYEKLLARREAARLSQEMDSSADKVIQFRVIDPPEAPIQPSGPRKVVFATLVLLAALGVGGAVSAALVYYRQSFVSARHLRDNFDLPVLGSVSASLTAAARRAERVSAGLFAVSLVALFVSYVAVALYFSRTLPPLNDVVNGLI